MATYGPRFDPKYQASLDLWKKNPVALKEEYDRIASDKSIDINNPNTIGHLQRLGEFSALHKKSGNTIADINTDTGLEANPPVITGQPEKKESTTTTSTYTSPYSEDIGRTLAALSNRQPFSYNPNTDQGLEFAQQSVADAVSRVAARKNMLYSTSNKAQMGEAALALVPQFRQQAFNEYQGQGQEQNQLLNTLLGIENQQYGRFRDTVGDTRYADETGYARGRDAVGDTRYADETAYTRQIQQQQAAAQEEQRAIENAWVRVQSVGFVDNQSAEILGISAGTPTFQAQQAYEQRKMQNQQFQAELGVQYTRLAQDASQFNETMTQRKNEQANKPVELDPKDSSDTYFEAIGNLEEDETLTKAEAKAYAQLPEVKNSLSAADYKRLLDYIEENY